jgi:hypothetical protein
MTSSAPTRLRLVPTPRWEPAEDQEPAAAAEAAPPAVQGALALAFALPGGLPEQPTPPPLRLLAGGRARAVDAPEALAAGDESALERLFGPQATAREALPEPRAWAARIAQAVVEVLAGDRPASQLVRWTAVDVYDGIRRRARTRRPQGGQPPRAAVRSVRVCEPADGVVEACAVVRRGGRYHAVALRLQGLDGRWQCTALQLG